MMPIFSIRAIGSNDIYHHISATLLLLCSSFEFRMWIPTQGMKSVSADVVLSPSDDEQNAVGFASPTIKNALWQATNLGHLDELIVDEKHCGCGLGTQLFARSLRLPRSEVCARGVGLGFSSQTGRIIFTNEMVLKTRAYLSSRKFLTMSPQERSRLEKLDCILRSGTMKQQILSVVSRVRTKLARKPQAMMTWETIALDVFGSALPTEIRSGWVFGLRAGADTGAERHPNSHQRMMSMEGSGDMRTEQEGTWQSNLLISEPAASLEQRWISIPPNVWHRPVISSDMDWIVVSFHTVPAEELIEERPSPSTADGTTRMRYLDA
jgi:hypothetical protein